MINSPSHLWPLYSFHPFLLTLFVLREADLRLVLWPRKHWRLITECEDAHLDEAQQVIVWMGPVVEVGEVDLAAGVHVFAHLDLHVGCGFHKGHGGWVGWVSSRVSDMRIL